MARKHERYYAIPAYQILAKKTSKECAAALGITERTYWNKINGFSDFSIPEAMRLSDFLGRKNLDDIFLT
jgi:plasmid maintenance system antidote protein VapI